MASLPQLIEEDILALDQSLREFLSRSDATTALVIEIGRASCRERVYSSV